MHDKYGREIELGDIVATQKEYQSEKVKVVKVAALYPGSETCNIGVHAFEVREGQQSANAKDSILLVKADGTLVLPPAQEEVKNG